MDDNRKVVLMFSGGRDSTISAIKLASIYHEIKLVTVISDHLYGLPIVRKRISELRNILKPSTEWICVIQPEYKKNDDLTWRTCLPCQRAYVAIGAHIAIQYKIKNIALGYTHYQQNFPEQHPYAISRLYEVLNSFGLNLVLPAINIQSKEAAIKELINHDLTETALEQKCIKQIINIELKEDYLIAEIERWVNGIKEIINNKIDWDIIEISNNLIGDIKS